MKNILVLRCPYVVQKSWTTVTWFANITRVVTRINENTSHSSTMTFVALFWPGASYIKEDERQTSRQYAITAWMKVWERRSVPSPFNHKMISCQKSALQFLRSYSPFRNIPCAIQFMRSWFNTRTIFVVNNF